MAKRNLTCIICPLGCKIEVELSEGKAFNIEGNACDRGLSYAKEECTSPKRVLTTLVRVKGGSLPVTSVKTTKPIPKELVGEVQKLLFRITIEAPVEMGEAVLRDVMGTGADVVATRPMERISGSTS
jgi:CxxC motif-containing protein